MFSEQSCRGFLHIGGITQRAKRVTQLEQESMSLLGLAKVLAEQARRRVLILDLIPQGTEPVVQRHQELQPLLFHRRASATGF